MIEINNDVYVPTPHIAETSPHGHLDVRRGFPNPPHAGEARRNRYNTVNTRKMVKKLQKHCIAGVLG